MDSNVLILNRWIAALQMMRPANILTAWADIWVGVAIAGILPTAIDSTISLVTLSPLLWLLIATTGLYGGGVVFNDVFDAELDGIERPERPIPSGRASLNFGIGLGIVLLIIGILAAIQVSWVSGAIATIIAFLALFYDAVGKHHPIVGPLNMGMCRGANWLLGVSIVPSMLEVRWFLSVIPILYIAAITVMSRGEVQGGSRRTGMIAIGLLGLVVGALFSLDLLPNFTMIFMVPFGLVWGYLVWPAFIQATRNPTAELIRQAVRAGIIALIALDSAIVAGFSHWSYGLLVLALLPISRILAKQFAVT